MVIKNIEILNFKFKSAASLYDDEYLIRNFFVLIFTLQL